MNLKSTVSPPWITLPTSRERLIDGGLQNKFDYLFDGHFLFLSCFLLALVHQAANLALLVHLTRLGSAAVVSTGYAPPFIKQIYTSIGMCLIGLVLHTLHNPPYLPEFPTPDRPSLNYFISQFRLLSSMRN